SCSDGRRCVCRRLAIVGEHPSAGCLRLENPGAIHLGRGTLRMPWQPTSWPTPGRGESTLVLLEARGDSRRPTQRGAADCRVAARTAGLPPFRRRRVAFAGPRGRRPPGALPGDERAIWQQQVAGARRLVAVVPAALVCHPLPQQPPVPCACVL